MARKVLAGSLTVLVCALPLTFGCSSSGSNPDAGHKSDASDAKGETGGSSGGGAGGSNDGGGTAGTGGSGPDAAVDSQADGQAGTDGGGDTAPDAAPDAGEDLNNVTDVRAERAMDDAASAPNAPTNLAAAVLDRRETSFQLSWTAPATFAGGPVSTYDVRVATVPITAANFDDSSVGVIPYSKTPAAVGQPDGVFVTGLYIEAGYYFAVAAVDGGGNRGPIAATSAAVAAHFNVTTLAAPSATNEQFGHSVSGDGDLNGDGISDIAVGTVSSTHAYLFLGGAAFGATAPSVTFTGASTGFGFSVAQIGDIDHDGLPDLAISDSQMAQKIYIYKGRTTWPATLTDAQADYTISTDASYAATFFGYSIARLGDFTGDQIDDFAIGVRSYNTNKGRVVIIPGQAGFTSVSLPDAARSIVIDGDATVGNSLLGYKVLGIGHLYTTTSGTTLIASAIGSATSTPANRGDVYAFHGQPGSGGVISITAADAVFTGSADGTRIGTNLTNLGSMLPGSRGVGVGAALDNTDVASAGCAFLTFGTSTTGPFQSKVVAYSVTNTLGGGVLIGGGLPGSDVSVSLIGDSTPNLVLGGQNLGRITISDGAHYGTKPNPNEVGATAEVVMTLPTGWSSSEGTSGIVKDINGDHVADFVLGSAGQPGGVLVFW